ncbi:VOC family protein [Paraburkholderia sp. GAS32]|uniref:VOC family protein n=1 Tax=Paraburkholderia sp. GAS32 TaxID=3035129 RepID=UPI003D2208C3
MSLHRITDITLGVPDLREAIEYYTQFGLIAQPVGQNGDQWFGTVDGGDRQLRLVRAPVRRLVSLGIGADDLDDLSRITAALQRLQVASHIEDNALFTKEPITGLDVTVSVVPRVIPKSFVLPAYNYPGSIGRPNDRAPAALRTAPVRPRRLGHIGIGSVDSSTTRRFFMEGLGFKLSDQVKDYATFMRCSTDHHNVVVQTAPVNFLHHTSWEVEDIDEIGRGARAMLEGHPERHTWGIGRHWVGSNFFYYFRDPAGNLSEYYSDMDEINDDQLWKPGVFEVAEAANVWGPPMPPSLIEPDDLAELMAGLH